MKASITFSVYCLILFQLPNSQKIRSKLVEAPMGMSQLKRETRSLPDIEDGEEGRAHSGEKRDRGGPGTTRTEKDIQTRSEKERTDEEGSHGEMMEGEGKRPKRGAKG